MSKNAKISVCYGTKEITDSGLQAALLLPLCNIRAPECLQAPASKIWTPISCENLRRQLQKRKNMLARKNRTAFSWRHKSLTCMMSKSSRLLLLLAACCSAIVRAEKGAAGAAPVLQQVVLDKNGPVGELDAAQSQLLAAGRFAHDQLQLRYCCD
jgi:hypothetical protein